MNRLFSSYRDSWRFLVDSKNFLLFIVFVFLFSALIGVLFPHFFSDSISSYLSSLYDTVKDFSFFRLFLFIVNNNISSALSSFLFGLAFGIFPVIVLVINGYVLGFVASKSVSLAGPGVLWRLLPHGIFELPAIFISGALGLRAGFSFFTKSGRKNFRKTFIGCVLVFVRIVVPLLIIAGLIESSLIVLLK